MSRKRKRETHSSLWTSLWKLDVLGRLAVFGSCASILSLFLALSFYPPSIDTLGTVLFSPVALVAALVGMGGWIWIAHRTRRLRMLMDDSANLPKTKLAELIRLELDTVLPESISSDEWLRLQRLRAGTFCVLLVCLVVVSLAAVWAWNTQVINRTKAESLNRKVQGLETKLISLLEEERRIQLEVAQISGEAAVLGRLRSDPELEELAKRIVGIVDGVEPAVAKHLSNADKIRFAIARALSEMVVSDYARVLELLPIDKLAALDTEAQEASELAARTHMLRAQAQRGLRRWSAAIGSYDKALRFQPFDWQAASGKGICLSEARRESEAIELFDQWIAFFQGKPTLHGRREQDERANRPQLAEAYWLRAKSKMRLSMTDAALSDLDDALTTCRKLDPASDEQLAMQMALVKHDIGFCYFKAGRNEEAVKQFGEVIQKAEMWLSHPKPVQFRWRDFLASAIGNRAAARIRTNGRGDAASREALKEFERSVSLRRVMLEEGAEEARTQAREGLATVLTNFGISLMGNAAKDTAQAIAYHTEAIALLASLIRNDRVDLYPLISRVYYNRALCQTFLDDYSAAIIDLKESIRLRWKAIEIDGTQGNALEMLMAAKKLAWIRACHVDGDFRDGEEAVALATLAVDISPDLESRVCLAAAFAESADFDQAIRWQRSTFQFAADLAMPQLQQMLDLYESKTAFRGDLPSETLQSLRDTEISMTFTGDGGEYEVRIDPRDPKLFILDKVNR